MEVTTAGVCLLLCALLSSAELVGGAGSGGSAMVDPNYSSNYQGSTDSVDITQTNDFLHNLTSDLTPTVSVQNTFLTQSAQSFVPGTMKSSIRGSTAISAPEFSTLYTPHILTSSLVASPSDSVSSSSFISATPSSSLSIAFSSSRTPLKVLASSSPSLLSSSLDLSPPIVSTSVIPSVSSSSLDLLFVSSSSSFASSITPSLSISSSSVVAFTTDFVSSSFVSPTPSSPSPDSPIPSSPSPDSPIPSSPSPDSPIPSSPSPDSPIPSSPSSIASTSSGTSTSTESTAAAGSGSAAATIPGIIAAVAFMVIAGSVMMVVIASLCWLRKQKRTGKHTVFENKKSPLRSPIDDMHALNPTSTKDENSFQLGLDTNSLSLLSFPDTPAPAGGEDLPALVFINPVDPSIPVSSNTLPSRGKLKTSRKGKGRAVLESHFSSRGSKSAESVDKLGRGSDDALDGDMKLKELPPQSTAVETKAAVDTESLSKLAGGTLNQSGGNYGFFFKRDKEKGSIVKESSTSFDIDKDSKTTEVASSVQEEATSMDVGALTVTKKTETSFPGSPVISAPDKSHYDIPRKLIEQIRSKPEAKAKQSKEAIDSKEKCESTFEDKHKRPSDQSDGNTNTESGIPRTNTYVNVTINKSTGTPVVKTQGEGIYDVPRSVLVATSSSPEKDKNGPPPTKPKVAPRALATKMTSVIADSYSCKAAGDNTTATKGTSASTEVLASNKSESTEIIDSINTAAAAAQHGNSVRSEDVTKLSTGKNNTPESSSMEAMPMKHKDNSGHDCSSVLKGDSIKKEETPKNLPLSGKPQVLPRPKGTTAKASSEKPRKPPVTKRKPNAASRRTTTHSTAT